MVLYLRYSRWLNEGRNPRTVVVVNIIVQGAGREDNKINNNGSARWLIVRAKMKAQQRGRH